MALSSFKRRPCSSRQQGSARDYRPPYNINGPSVKWLHVDLSSLPFVSLSGLSFRLDPSTCPQRELVFSRDLTVARLTSPKSCRVLGNTPLTNGRHYWKVKIDQFCGLNHDGSIAVGVSKRADPEGMPLGKSGEYS